MIIEEILNDLYKLDPTLKESEEELKKVISQLIAARPGVKIDENFKIKLEQELLEKFKIITGQPIKHQAAWNKFALNKFFYVMSGGMAMLLLVGTSILIINQLPRKNNHSQNQIIKLSLKQTINKTSANAFGSLPSLQNSYETSQPVLNSFTKKDNTNFSAQDSESKSLSAKATMAPKNNSNSARILAVGSAAAPNMMIYPPKPQPTFKYTYVGKDIELNNENLAIYKRDSKNILASQLGKIVGKIDTGLINLNSFSNLKVNNLSLQENYDGGYNLNFNLDNENINLYKNYSANTVSDSCSDKTVCIPDYYISKDKMPSAEEIVGITNEFLKVHGVDLSFWGDPKVDESWTKNEEFQKNNYAPANITVIYPQKIEEKLVYNDSGKFSGMTVNVNLKNHKVDSIYNLTAQNFISSDYKAITDWKKVLDFALKGGLQPNIYYILNNNNNKQVKVELDTPFYALVDRWVYDKTSQELFVPALIFPIKNKPLISDSNNSDNIIVPLVEEMFPKEGDNNNIINPTRESVKTNPTVEIIKTEIVPPSVNAN